MIFIPKHGKGFYSGALRYTQSVEDRKTRTNDLEATLSFLIQDADMRILGTLTDYHVLEGFLFGVGSYFNRKPNWKIFVICFGLLKQIVIHNMILASLNYKFYGFVL